MTPPPRRGGRCRMSRRPRRSGRAWARDHGRLGQAARLRLEDHEHGSAALDGVHLEVARVMKSVERALLDAHAAVHAPTQVDRELGQHLARPVGPLLRLDDDRVVGAASLAEHARLAVRLAVSSHRHRERHPRALRELPLDLRVELGDRRVHHAAEDGRHALADASHRPTRCRRRKRRNVDSGALPEARDEPDEPDEKHDLHAYEEPDARDEHRAR